MYEMFHQVKKQGSTGISQGYKETFRAVYVDFPMSRTAIVVSGMNICLAITINTL